MSKQRTPTLAVLAAAVVLGLAFGGLNRAAPPEGKGKPPKDGGDGGGKIYFSYEFRLRTMNPDGMAKSPVVVALVRLRVGDILDRFFRRFLDGWRLLRGKASRK